MSGAPLPDRIAEDAAGAIANAQEGNCPACGRSLRLGGAVLTFAAEPGGGSPVAVVVHEDCLRDGRLWPRFEDLLDGVEGDDRTAAQTALEGAVAHARAAVEDAAQEIARAAVEKAQSEAAATIEKARSEAAAAVEKARSEAAAAVEKARSEAAADADGKAKQTKTDLDLWTRYAEQLEAAAVAAVCDLNGKTIKALENTIDKNRCGKKLQEGRRYGVIRQT